MVLAVIGGGMLCGCSLFDQKSLRGQLQRQAILLVGSNLTLEKALRHI